MRISRLLRLAAITAAVIVTMTLDTGDGVAAIPVTAPSIAVGAAGPSVSGITPGASPILFTISRVRRGYISGHSRLDALMTPADAAGSSHFDSSSIAPHSIWCVIDPVSGRYSVAGPGEYLVRTLPVPAHALLAVNGSAFDRLHAKHGFMEVLWVRPGVGGWKASVGDGGASDADGIVNGHISIAPQAMLPLRGSPAPPASFLPTDTIVAVDPATMEFFTLGGAQ